MKVLHIVKFFLVSQERRHQTASVLLFCNIFKQLYLKDERVNIIPSIKNEHCFIYLRRKVQNKLYLGIEHLHHILGRHFEITRHLEKPAGIS